jgi:hypothetical protein
LYNIATIEVETKKYYYTVEADSVEEAKELVRAGNLLPHTGTLIGNEVITIEEA